MDVGGRRFGSREGVVNERGRRTNKEEKAEERRVPHSRRLSCSPSAYHGVTGQDLYVEFIVAESALVRFMDVFRRSAAARVIYRSTLSLPFPSLQSPPPPNPLSTLTNLVSLQPCPVPLCFYEYFSLLYLTLNSMSMKEEWSKNKWSRTRIWKEREELIGE